MSNYKPKSSCLEIGILKTRDEDRMNTFTSALATQKVSQDAKRERQLIEQDYQKQLDL